MRSRHLALAGLCGAATALLATAAGCAGAAGARAASTAGAGGAEAAARSRLYPICVGARMGLIDRSGAVIVAPKLGWIDETIAELTKVWVLLPVPPGEERPGLPPPGAAGFVDTRGRFAVEPVYEDAHPFSDGLAAVKRQGRWGYVDGRGVVRIPLQFEEARPFSEGIALVRDDRGQRFIDAKGRTVIDVASLRWRRGSAEFPVVADGPFFDGLAAFRIILHGERPDTLVGFIDREGRIVIEPAFTYSYAFQGGYATVQVECGKTITGRCEGIVRRDGSWAIPPTHEFLASVQDGLAAFSAPVGKAHLFGFLSERNEVVVPPTLVPPTFEYSCLWFGEGLCQTKIGERWAYVDRAGAEVLVLPPDTESADPFFEGFAVVRTARGGHYIGRDGKRAFAGEFKEAGRFRGDLAPVQFHGGGQGYIDHAGHVVYRQDEPCTVW